MKALPQIILGLALCLCAFSCLACESGLPETDPALLTVSVSEMEPPILDLLAKMEAMGMDVAGYQELFGQPAATEIPLQELRSLPVELRQFALMTDSEPDGFLAGLAADALDRLLGTP